MFLYCLTSFHWTLPRNDDGFGLPISKLSENTLLHISNTFLEAFLIFKISWQWEWHYGKYCRNHCFHIVWQDSDEHCLKIIMDLDCPYQNWGKHFCTYQTHFCKHFKNLKQVDSDSDIMEIL